MLSRRARAGLLARQRSRREDPTLTGEVVGGQDPIVDTDVQLRQFLVDGGGGHPLQQLVGVVTQIADGATQVRRQARHPIHRVAALRDLKEGLGSASMTVRPVGLVSSTRRLGFILPGRERP